MTRICRAAEDSSPEASRTSTSQRGVATRCCTSDCWRAIFIAVLARSCFYNWSLHTSLALAHDARSVDSVRSSVCNRPRILLQFITTKTCLRLLFTVPQVRRSARVPATMSCRAPFSSAEHTHPNYACPKSALHGTALLVDLHSWGSTMMPRRHPFVSRELPPWLPPSSDDAQRVSAPIRFNITTQTL